MESSGPLAQTVSDTLSRREFLTSATAAGLAMSLGVASKAEEKNNDMLYRPLGRTGQQVSALGLGGHHIGIPKDEAEGIRIIRSAIDQGITFMDNSWDYHNGGSELRMGKALRDGYREKVFLMTKIDGRTKAAAATPVQCLHYALNLPTSTVITGIDSLDVLKQDLAAVRSFKPLSQQDLAELLQRTAAPAATGEYERFKTTSDFDATGHNPQWLG